MDNHHCRKMPNLPARLLDTQAEVRFLAVEEEALIEKSDAEERLAPGNEKRAGSPVACLLTRVPAEVELAFTQPPGVERETLRAEGFAEHPHCGRESAHRRGDRAFRRELK